MISSLAGGEATGFTHEGQGGEFESHPQVPLVGFFPWESLKMGEGLPCKGARTRVSAVKRRRGFRCIRRFQKKKTVM